MTLVALSPAIFFVSISSVMRGYFNARQNIKATARSQSLEQVFKTTLTIILVEIIAIISNSSTEWMAGGATLATTLATFAGFGYLYLYYRTRKAEIAAEIKTTVNYKYERVLTIIKKILMVSIPIALTAIMSSINKNIDSFTVVRSLKQFMSEDMAISQYGILGGKVDMLTSLPLSINVAFSTALVPAISAAKARNAQKEITQKTSFSLLISMLIGLPCTVGMFLFAGPILNLLFPNASSGEVVLKISSLTIIFTILDQTINGALQGYGKLIIPTISLGCRSNSKTNSKFNFSTNTINRCKWSSMGFCSLSFSCIYHCNNFFKKNNKIRFSIFKICYKTSHCSYYYGNLFIF
jgi:stage V sporulation protein B